MKERQLQKQRRELEEEIQCIERKKVVQQQENEKAHNLAQQHRENKYYEQIFEQKLKQMQNMASGLSGAVPQQPSAKGMEIDYTKSRFHAVNAPAVAAPTTVPKSFEDKMKQLENF